jgi:integrase
MSDETLNTGKGKPPARPTFPRKANGKRDDGAWNRSVRPREYLTSDEIERMIRAAGRIGRHGERDATMIYVGFVHGYRVTELLRLRADAYDFNQGVLHVTRIKNGSPAVHPVKRREAGLIKKILDGRKTGLVFTSERGTAVSRNSFQKIMSRAGELMTVEGQKEPGLSFPVHPHMLRHSCGFHLRKQGWDIRVIQAYLGHKNINHTVGYTALDADAFKGGNFE